MKTRTRNFVPVALEWGIMSLVFCIGLAIFYRDPIFSGFREIVGGGDARAYTFFLEHWRKVFAAPLDGGSADVLPHNRNPWIL